MTDRDCWCTATALLRPAVPASTRDRNDANGLEKANRPNPCSKPRYAKAPKRVTPRLQDNEASVCQSPEACVRRDRSQFVCFVQSCCKRLAHGTACTTRPRNKARGSLCWLRASSSCQHVDIQSSPHACVRVVCLDGSSSRSWHLVCSVPEAAL